MKKIIACVLSLSMMFVTLAACTSKGTETTTSKATNASDGNVESKATGAESKETSGGGGEKSVSLTVVTSYGGDDGNRANYEAAVKAFESASGHKVNDASGTANEAWKTKVMADFQTGAEPDIVFFFNGVDSNPLIEGQKMVSIDTIRSVYPEYASNMKDELLGASPVDGKNYSVPVNGYWENMYINQKVLEDCGIAIPDATYTWEQFIKDCQIIKDKGYTPIAASLQEVPHYWFEYTVFNNGTVGTHNQLPESSTDTNGMAWVAGLEDMKELYSAGFFPENTLTATDGETCQLMIDNKAAFLVDGSWKLGWFQENASSVDDFTVSYFPGKNDRKTTDIVGGLSMGYYITMKAWNDPDKQKACVDFVQAMTTDEVISTFGATTITALKKGTVAPTDADSLTLAAVAMTSNVTGIAPAAQDNLLSTARTALFSDIKLIMTEASKASEVIDKVLKLNQE